MDLEYIINHTKTAIKNAYNNFSSLPESVLEMEGMSGKKTRHLYNNICNIDNKVYLEIGPWKGSSFISSMYSNRGVYAYCIDNWSQFNGPKDIFLNNIAKYLPALEQNIKIINKDSWLITENDITKPIDIYLYDGAHTYDDQKKAITYYHNYFSKYSIIMVDDWYCDHVDVKRGTLDGIKEMNLKVHFIHETPLVKPDARNGPDPFWNGCGIFVCERTDI